MTAVVDGLPVETTTYRVEGAYSDMRHPDESFASWRTCARTSPAAYSTVELRSRCPPHRGLLDPYGGREDLLRGVIRAVGSRAAASRRTPCASCAPCASRAASALPSIPPTQEALAACAPELGGIASERVGQEMDGILASGRVAWALRHEFDVMSAAIPELAPMRGFDQKSPYHAYDVLEHTARVCAGVEEFTGGMAPRALRWAALLHDVAKPSTWSEDEGGRGHSSATPGRARASRARSWAGSPSTARPYARPRP